MILSPIDLDTDHVRERAGQALGELLESWDMNFDIEPRERIRQAGMLLDLLWENETRARATQSGIVD